MKWGKKAKLAGCCTCGTTGTEDAVTRYGYAGKNGLCDWVACSKHKAPGRAPAVDYGTDRAVLLDTVEYDVAEAR